MIVVEIVDVLTDPMLTSELHGHEQHRLKHDHGDEERDVNHCDSTDQSISGDVHDVSPSGQKVR